jgi:hypothetical protein
VPGGGTTLSQRIRVGFSAVAAASVEGHGPPDPDGEERVQDARVVRARGRLMALRDTFLDVPIRIPSRLSVSPAPPPSPHRNQAVLVSEWPLLFLISQSCPWHRAAHLIADLRID